MLILFDIDGTLLRGNGCGKAATYLAMQEVFGTVGTLDNFRFRGNTDWQMLAETLQGIVNHDEIPARLVEYDDAMARALREVIPNFHMEVCKGAPEFLQLCVDDPEITVALLTGNMPTAARVKLEAAGYDPDVFEFGVYGSEAVRRTDLTPLALARVWEVKQLRYHPEQVWVIGDTPDDIACARAIGARVIAVGTGSYTMDELAEYQPDLLLPNLSEPETILARIKAAYG